MQYFQQFGEVFKDRLFQIPDYQRSYSWEQRQHQDLLEDLELLTDDQQKHFFGTIILHTQGEVSHIQAHNGQPYKMYDVVDGQQRLTTVVIYLDVIRRALLEFEQALAAELRDQHILVYDGIGQPAARLRLNQDTHSFFFNEILGLGQEIEHHPMRSHRRLLEAKEFFTSHLAQKREEFGEDYAQWLVKQYQRLTRQLTVIVYAAENNADAALIFASMNDRGKPITEMEKVKSYLLYVAGKLNLQADYDLAANINSTWAHIYKELMRSGLSDRRHEDQLLRTHWLMAYDPYSANWKGAHSIKTRLDLRNFHGHEAELFTAIRDYLNTLKNSATAYCDILNPTRTGAFGSLHSDAVTHTRIIKESKRLARVGSLATFLPLLIAVRLRYATNALEYLETAELCEKYAFRVYRWRGWRSNTGQSRLFSLGHALFSGKDIDTVQDEIKRTIFGYCSDAQFRERFRSETTDWYRWSGIKYFLYEYEQHLADKRKLEVKMLWDTLLQRQNTIEHILPQTPDSGGYWEARFTPEKYGRYLHDIGNLTLTFDDPTLSNRPYNDHTDRAGKKSFYRRSALFMEQEIAENYEDWTLEAIELRRAQIEDWAVQRWRIEQPSSSSPTEAGGRRYTLDRVLALADENGVGQPLRDLLAACERHGLGARAWRWCVTIAPPQGRQYALMAIWPQPGKLATGVWKGSFPNFFPAITLEKTDEIIGPTDHSIDESNVSEFIQKLDTLFDITSG